MRLYELAFIQKARRVSDGPGVPRPRCLYELAFIQKARPVDFGDEFAGGASMNSPSYRRRDKRNTGVYSSVTGLYELAFIQKARPRSEKPRKMQGKT